MMKNLKVLTMRIHLIWLILFLGCSTNCEKYEDDEDTRPEIIKAAKIGDFKTVKQLLADDPLVLTATDEYGQTAADYAILNDHHEIAIYLIEYGLPLKKNSHSLILSCLSRTTHGSEVMLEYLLKNGASPNIRNDSGSKPLLNTAVNNAMENKVRLLVKYGALIDSKDGFGLTSMQLAKKQLSQYKDPDYHYPHGELCDPKFRQGKIDEWESMVKLLSEIQDAKDKNR